MLLYVDYALGCLRPTHPLPRPREFHIKMYKYVYVYQSRYKEINLHDFSGENVLIYHTHGLVGVSVCVFKSPHSFSLRAGLKVRCRNIFYFEIYENFLQ